MPNVTGAAGEMRWDNLFDDLESQLEHELDAEELDLRAEQERLRLARLTVRDRLMSMAEVGDAALAMRLVDGQAVSVRPVTFGKDWFAADLISPGPFRHGNDQVIVPLGAIAAITMTPASLAAGTAEPAGPRSRLVDRLGLPFVLRDLCRRRAAVTITAGGMDAHGTIDRVGRDHLDLAVHEPGSSRRAANVSEVRMVPLATVVLLRVR